MKVILKKSSIIFKTDSKPVWINPDDKEYFDGNTNYYSQQGVGASTIKMTTPTTINKLVLPKIKAGADCDADYVVFYTSYIKTDSSTGQICAELYGGFREFQTIIAEGTVHIGTNDQQVAISFDEATVPTDSLVEVILYNPTTKLFVPIKVNKNSKTSPIVYSTTSNSEVKTATWSMGGGNYSTMSPILYKV